MAAAFGSSGYDPDTITAVTYAIRIAIWVIVFALAIGIIVALVTNNHSPKLLAIGFFILFALSLFLDIRFRLAIGDSGLLVLLPAAYAAPVVGAAGFISSVLAMGQTN